MPTHSYKNRCEVPALLRLTTERVLKARIIPLRPRRTQVLLGLLRVVMPQAMLDLQDRPPLLVEVMRDPVPGNVRRERHVDRTLLLDERQILVDQRRLLIDLQEHSRRARLRARRQEREHEPPWLHAWPAV